MAQTGQTGQKKRLLTLCGLGLALLTGCSTTPTAATQPHDPLHGVLTPPGLPQPTHSPKTPGSPASFTPQSNNPNLKPIGWDLSSSNNATLAGLSGQGPLGRPLAIDDQGRPLAPGQFTTGPKTQQTPVQLGYPGANPNPKVEAIPDANAPSKYTPNSWQPEQPTGPAPNTPEALTRQLQERGVINQKLDQLSQGVHLTCYVSRGPEGGLRILEVTAVDYVSAAQAILQQLDTAR